MRKERRQADHDGMTRPEVVKLSRCCSCTTCLLNLSSITFVFCMSSSNPPTHSGPLFFHLTILWPFLFSTARVFFFASSYLPLLSGALGFHASTLRLFFPVSSPSELSGVVVSLCPAVTRSPVASGRLLVGKSVRCGRRIAADCTFRLITGGRRLTEMAALTGRIVSYFSGLSFFHDTSPQNTLRHYTLYGTRSVTVYRQTVSTLLHLSFTIKQQK